MGNRNAVRRNDATKETLPERVDDGDDDDDEMETEQVKTAVEERDVSIVVGTEDVEGEDTADARGAKRSAIHEYASLRGRRRGRMGEGQVSNRSCDRGTSKRMRLLLDEETIRTILSHLTLYELTPLACATSRLWKDLSDLTSSIRVLRKVPHINLWCAKELKWSVLACRRLMTIDFSDNSLVDDELVGRLEDALKRCGRTSLRRLIFDKCDRVTDRSICKLLAPSSLRYHRVRDIGVVFCPAVGLKSMLDARRAKCTLRRIPSWFVGSWRCESHPGIPTGETHVYYPDGSFEFSRGEQSSGYCIAVNRVFGRGECVIDVKIRYHFLHLWMYSPERTYPTVRCVRLRNDELSLLPSGVLLNAPGEDGIDDKGDDDVDDGRRIDVSDGRFMMSAQAMLRVRSDVMLPTRPGDIRPNAHYDVGFWRRLNEPSQKTAITLDLANSLRMESHAEA